MKNEIIASINLGSNSLGLMISQINANGKMKILEDLKMPTNAGRDTFATKRINIKTINEICEVFNGFHQIINDYNIKWYRAVATSSIREAENREYVLEQIRMKAGINIEIINSSQERFFINKALYEVLPGIEGMVKKGVLVINIGSGGIEISVYDKKYLKFTEYIKVGSLRMREILSNLEKKTLDFASIMEQYLDSKMYPIKSIIKNMSIKNFVGLGGEFKSSNFLIKNDDGYINKKAINELFDDIKNVSMEKIMEKYKLHKNQAEFLLPSLIILRSFFNITDAKGVYIPTISLRYGLLINMVDEMFNTERGRKSVKDILGSMWYMCEKYGADINHSKCVKKFAINIFDGIKNIHGFSEKEKFYLKSASILHDIGKYVDINNNEIYCYNIIKAENIMGLSEREKNIIAATAMYHGEMIPKNEHKQYKYLSEEDKIVVSKLAAILKLAEALDTSHKQKIKDLHIDIGRTKAKFLVYSDYDITLEKWSFNKRSNFFNEVMGIEAVVKEQK